MGDIITAVISGGALCIVAIINGLMLRDRKHAAEHAERRAEESRLSMEMMYANSKLSTATARAVTGQETNGEIEEALKAAQKSQEEYTAFLKKITSEQVAKI